MSSPSKKVTFWPAHTPEQTISWEINYWLYVMDDKRVLVLTTSVKIISYD